MSPQPVPNNEIQISKPEDAFTLSTANSYEMGLFARFAQAAHLLSQVLHQVAEHSRDTGQLRRTIYALVQVSRIEASVRQLEYCTQMAVCYWYGPSPDHPRNLLTRQCNTPPRASQVIYQWR